MYDNGCQVFLRLSYLCVMGVWRQIGEYLYLKKRDPKAPRDTNIRLMHGMNRISIFIFLIALGIILVRLFRHLFHF
jgi:hypothetical protein